MVSSVSNFKDKHDRMGRLDDESYRKRSCEEAGASLDARAMIKIYPTDRDMNNCLRLLLPIILLSCNSLDANAFRRWVLLGAGFAQGPARPWTVR